MEEATPTGKKCDVLVIGAGPGGYVAAIRLGQLGKKVILAEKNEVGGTCLNIGCIPSKALIYAGDLFYRIKHSHEIGIIASPSLDMEKLQKWKASVVEKLRKGIEFLCKSNNVDIMKGEASLLSSTEASVKTTAGKVTVEFQ